VKICGQEILSRHSHWNLIASGASQDVAIDIAASLQYDDRFNVSIFVGDDEIEFPTRELEFIGTWLGMLSLELGRGIDHTSEARGIQSELLRLIRESGKGFQIEYESASVTRAVTVRGNQVESLRASLEQALRELGAR